MGVSSRPRSIVRYDVAAQPVGADPVLLVPRLTIVHTVSVAAA
jgi:hypothetical protein